MTLLFLSSLQSWGQNITTEPLTIDQSLPTLPVDPEVKTKPEMNSTAENKKEAPLRSGLGVYLGFGIPSVAIYGIHYFNENPNGISFAFQGGEGQLQGANSYRDSFKELIFLANGSDPNENMLRHYGIGLGQQEFEAETFYTDNLGFFYNEKETFSKTYIKFLFSTYFFQGAHVYYGADFGIAFPMSVTSQYSATDAVRAINLKTGPYAEIQNNFKLFKSLFGTGVSFQITFF